MAVIKEKRIVVVYPLRDLINDYLERIRDINMMIERHPGSFTLVNYKKRLRQTLGQIFFYKRNGADMFHYSPDHKYIRMTVSGLAFKNNEGHMCIVRGVIPPMGSITLPESVHCQMRRPDNKHKHQRRPGFTA